MPAGRGAIDHRWQQAECTGAVASALASVATGWHALLRRHTASRCGGVERRRRSAAVADSGSMQAIDCAVKYRNNDVVSPSTPRRSGKKRDERQLHVVNSNLNLLFACTS